MIRIDELIKEAMKSKNSDELKAYKNLKSEIQIIKTAKNAKPYDDTVEIHLISKMCKKLEDEAQEFEKAGRLDLAQEYRKEKSILEKLLPEPVGESEILGELFHGWYLKQSWGAICSAVHLMKIPKKEMGNAIKHLKSKFPGVDGKTISEIVKEYIE